MYDYYVPDLTRAIRERNKIEEEKVKLDRKVFEFNKQLNIDSVKANTDIAATLASFADMVRKINENIEKLFSNDAYLKQELDNLKSLISE